MQALELPSDALKPLRISRRTPSNGMETRSNLTPGAEGQPYRGDAPLSSSSGYNSRRAPRTLDLLSPGDLKVDTKVQSSSRVVRPLPTIPSAPSLFPGTPHSSSSSSSRAFRPLPSPPTSALSSTQSSPRCTMHPAPPPMPTIVEPTSQSKPQLPMLLTNPDLLKAPAGSHNGELESPESPQPPTPQTAKRKRMAKLRRHLGEPTLDESVYCRSVDVIADTKAQTLEDVPVLGEQHVYLRAAIAVGKILDMSDDEESDMEEQSLWTSPDDLGKDNLGEQQEDYSWGLHNGTLYHSFTNRRYSGRWMHDKGGRRWEESDYKCILQALRTL